MAKSFFEKLKKGMGIEFPIEEELEEEQKMKIKEIEIEDQPAPAKATADKEKKVIRKEPKITKKEDWLVPEGQLLIDVYQTKDELVIQSAIAGIKSESLNISLEGDVITIKGNRKKSIEEQGDYFTQECYWGTFSREIILPVETDPNRAKASMKEGILTIRMPKIFREKKRKITVKESSN